MDNNYHIKNIKQFVCEKCDFECSKKGDWKRHLLTRKHKNDNITDVNDNDDNNLYYCNCGKQYRHKSGLSRHKQVCIKNNEKTTILNSNLVFDFVKQMTETNELLIKHQIAENTENNKQTQDFQKQSLEFQQQMFQQMMEFMKLQCTVTNNTINNGQINNTNNHFNLHLYLNETCKNAMNIDQFIEYLQPTLQELEDTARLGYVEGITRIIMRGLKDLEESERPFHCSDLKRETMFVKNNNDIWEKEPDEKPQLLKVVKAISRKNFCNVSEWQKEHPTWRSCDSKHNDQYNQILINSTSGSTEKEQQESYEKIIKNIVKETVIDKSKKNK